jgi:hypothetical protein
MQGAAEILVRVRPRINVIDSADRSRIVGIVKGVVGISGGKGCVASGGGCAIPSCSKSDCAVGPAAGVKVIPLIGQDQGQGVGGADIYAVGALLPGDVLADRNPLLPGEADGVRISIHSKVGERQDIGKGIFGYGIFDYGIFGCGIFGCDEGGDKYESHYYQQ